jgi:SAM-dependent methyltransferase
MQRFVPAGSSVLEIGSGPGAISCLLARRLGCRVIGVDVDPQAVHYAQGLAEFIDCPAEFVMGSAFELPFAEGSFDVAFSTGVVEHWPEDLTRLSIAEHARIVKPAGRVIVAVPNLLNLPLTYHKWRAGEDFIAYPERSYTRWSLKALLARHGLCPIAMSGFAPSVSVEWYIWKGLPIRWLDRIRSDWLMSLIGYEVIAVGLKE